MSMATRTPAAPAEQEQCLVMDCPCVAVNECGWCAMHLSAAFGCTGIQEAPSARPEVLEMDSAEQLVSLTAAAKIISIGLAHKDEPMVDCRDMAQLLRLLRIAFGGEPKKKYISTLADHPMHNFKQYESDGSMVEELQWEVVRLSPGPGHIRTASTSSSAFADRQRNPTKTSLTRYLGGTPASYAPRDIDNMPTFAIGATFAAIEEAADEKSDWNFSPASSGPSSATSFSSLSSSPAMQMPMVTLSPKHHPSVRSANSSLKLSPGGKKRRTSSSADSHLLDMSRVLTRPRSVCSIDSAGRTNSRGSSIHAVVRANSLERANNLESKMSGGSSSQTLHHHRHFSIREENAWDADAWQEKIAEIFDFHPPTYAESDTIEETEEVLKLILNANTLACTCADAPDMPCPLFLVQLLTDSPLWAHLTSFSMASDNVFLVSHVLKLTWVLCQVATAHAGQCQRHDLLDLLGRSPSSVSMHSVVRIVYNSFDGVLGIRARKTGLRFMHPILYDSCLQMLSGTRKLLASPTFNNRMSVANGAEEVVSSILEAGTIEKDRAEARLRAFIEESTQKAKKKHTYARNGFVNDRFSVELFNSAVDNPVLIALAIRLLQYSPYTTRMLCMKNAFSMILNRTMKVSPVVSILCHNDWQSHALCLLEDIPFRAREEFALTPKDFASACETLKYVLLYLVYCIMHDWCLMVEITMSERLTRTLDAVNQACSQGNRTTLTNPRSRSYAARFTRGILKNIVKQFNDKFVYDLQGMRPNEKEWRTFFQILAVILKFVLYKAQPVTVPSTDSSSIGEEEGRESDAVCHDEHCEAHADVIAAQGYVEYYMPRLAQDGEESRDDAARGQEWSLNAADPIHVHMSYRYGIGDSKKPPKRKSPPALPSKGPPPLTGKAGNSSQESITEQEKKKQAQERWLELDNWTPNKGPPPLPGKAGNTSQENIAEQQEDKQAQEKWVELDDWSLVQHVVNLLARIGLDHNDPQTRETCSSEEKWHIKKGYEVYRLFFALEAIMKDMSVPQVPLRQLDATRWCYTPAHECSCTGTVAQLADFEAEFQARVQKEILGIKFGRKGMQYLVDALPDKSLVPGQAFTVYESKMTLATPTVNNKEIYMRMTAEALHLTMSGSAYSRKQEHATFARQMEQHRKQASLGKAATASEQEKAVTGSGGKLINVPFSAVLRFGRFQVSKDDNDGSGDRKRNASRTKRKGNVIDAVDAKPYSSMQFNIVCFMKQASFVVGTDDRDVFVQWLQCLSSVWSIHRYQGYRVPVLPDSRAAVPKVTLEQLGAVRPGVGPVMQSAKHVTRCQGFKHGTCTNTFKLFTKRTYCHLCGGVFCKSCTQMQVYLQNFGCESMVCVRCSTLHQAHLARRTVNVKKFSERQIAL